MVDAVIGIDGEGGVIYIYGSGTNCYIRLPDIARNKVKGITGAVRNPKASQVRPDDASTENPGDGRTQSHGIVNANGARAGISGQCERRYDWHRLVKQRQRNRGDDWQPGATVGETVWPVARHIANYKRKSGAIGQKSEGHGESAYIRAADQVQIQVGVAAGTAEIDGNCLPVEWSGGRRCQSYFESQQIAIVDLGMRSAQWWCDAPGGDLATPCRQRVDDWWFNVDRGGC